VNDFTILFPDSASFRAAADTLNGGTPRTPAQNIRPNATSIPGLTEASEVITWTYSAEPGDVSQPMSAGDDWVVAVLTDIKERGVPTLENVYDQMKSKVIQEKKAEMYAELMKTGTLQEIATATGSTIKKGSNITLKSSNIPGSGVSAQEHALIGACFGIPKGNISSPIKGEGGVYVIQRSTDVALVESQDGYLSDRDNLTKGYQARAAMSIFNSFREYGEVEDNRYERN
jgi:peptidyl-prolyl cis-trans isomerase D